VFRSTSTLADPNPNNPNSNLNINPNPSPNLNIKEINEMVLFFPFKDCVLEGGQSKDDEKRKEIFFNEVLAKDEINRFQVE
jgi:adenine specific DNA methylase Mod